MIAPRAAITLLALAVTSSASATKTSAPPPPLPMLPSVARVAVTVGKAQLVTVEEVNLPRGDWKGEPLEMYVAFGAPGLPRAVDAHLVSIGDGMIEADDSVAGETLTFDRAPRRPANAHALLGRETMAGIVVHVPSGAMSRALSHGNMASLRIRSVLDLPDVDASGSREVLVRLGAARGVPLTLGRITASSNGEGIARAEARLCGNEADPHPLAIAYPTKPRMRSDAIAPVLAVRHASDDLCVRVWTSAGP